jgi:glycosyltransferase involved in cell wall biosynthesis
VSKVLLFHYTELGGGLGGVEVAVMGLAEAFTKAGWASGIAEITNRWKPRRQLANGLPAWGITVPSYPTIWRPRSWASFVRTTEQFSRVIREFSPDVVHVHYPCAQALPVVGAQVVPHHWRVVVTVHNSDIRVTPFQEPRVRPWQARLFERADAVTAVSGGLLEDAAQLYPCIREKGRVIYNGVGPMWLREPGRNGHEEKYVLFVGRTDRVKGVDLLIHAWKQISSRFPAIQLWVVGEGSELDNLRTLAAELGVLSSVRFMGAKPQSELPALYQNAEAVVLPSRREGLPFSLLEAGAAGGICVGTKIPGIPEIIQDGITGLLVDPESPDALATALNRILTLPPEQRYQMREAAYRNVRDHFSEDQMVSGYIEVFESVVKKSKAGTNK